MTAQLTPAQFRPLAITAGSVYLILILFGLTSELALRPGMLTAVTEAEVTAALPAYRLSILSDAGMLICDAILTALLYLILRPAGPALALTATLLRLIQAAVIGAALMFQIAILALPDGMGELRDTLTATHAMGYDFGLIFFGVNVLITARLLCNAGIAGRWLPGLMMIAGLVYLTGSVTKFVAPEFNAMMQPAYGITALAELAFAITLTVTGLRARPASYVQAA